MTCQFFAQHKLSNDDNFWRKSYAVLANPELNPEEALLVSKSILNMAFDSTQIQPPFIYNESDFDSWLNEQQREQQKQSRLPHYLDSSEFSDSSVREYLLQRCPQNLHDCTFLSHVGTIGMCTQMEALLMKIKFEESGAGNHQENHNNLFYEMVSRELGIKLLAPEDFAKDPRFLDISFADAVFQLAIARFPKHYYAELMGMLLLLEWTGSLSAFKSMKLLKNRSINPYYYQVHVLADNPRNGHGFQIKEGIKGYLRDYYQRHGVQEQQHQWKRIYQGWHTWSAILDRFEGELQDYLIEFEANYRRCA